MRVSESRAWSEEFQPFDVADPFEFYARARAEAAAFYSAELDFWVVPRYADVLAILRDPATFSSENAQAPYHPRPPEVEQVLASGLAGKSGLLARQDPDHARLRAFINKAFTPRRVAVLEPRIRQLAARMIDRMAPLGQADWVADLAYDLPALVIFMLLGIPETDVPNVKRWARSRVQMNFGDVPAAEHIDHAHNVIAYWRYCEELVEARFDQPGDDLPSDLVRVYRDGDQSITKEEIAGLVFSQLTAGHETTTALLGTSFLELLRHRETWAALYADAALIPGAVDEMLRLCSPVFAVKRKAKRAAEIGGIAIPEGANVLLVLGSANHDSGVFADADNISLCRADAGKHLAFGQGIHYCLGAPLARLEAEIVLQELTSRLPSARLVEPQDITFSRNTSFRGPVRLLVEWDLAAR
jgi:cytochrome P450